MRFGKADHDALRVRQLEVAFAPFGVPGLGRFEALPEKIPVEGVYTANPQDHAVPGVAGAGDRPAQIDDGLSSTQCREGSIGAAVETWSPTR